MSNKSNNNKRIGSNSRSPPPHPRPRPRPRHAWVPLHQQDLDDVHDYEMQDVNVHHENNDNYGNSNHIDDDRHEVHHDLTPSASAVHHHLEEGDEEEEEEEEDDENERNFHNNPFQHHPISEFRRGSLQSDDDDDNEIQARDNDQHERFSGSKIVSLLSSSFGDDEDEEEKELNLQRYHHFHIDQDLRRNSYGNATNMKTFAWNVAPTNNDNNMNNTNPLNFRRSTFPRWCCQAEDDEEEESNTNSNTTNKSLQRTILQWFRLLWQAWTQIRQEDRRRRTERMLASPEWNMWNRFQFQFQTWCCDTTNRSIGLVFICIALWCCAIWIISDHPHRRRRRHHHHHEVEDQDLHVMSHTTRITLRNWLLGLGIPLLLLRLFWRPIYWYVRGRHVAAQRRARMEWYDYINQQQATTSNNASPNSNSSSHRHSKEYPPKSSDHCAHHENDETAGDDLRKHSFSRKNERDEDDDNVGGQLMHEPYKDDVSSTINEHRESPMKDPSMV